MDDSQPPAKRKILVIRFSSIGDIVLTTPVIRALKKNYPDSEIHILTKKANRLVLEYNPYITKFHTFSVSPKEILTELRDEQFDFVADLQKNHRSRQIVHLLGRPHATFNKCNFGKWLFVNLKINFLPDKHIVDRYFEAVAPLNVHNDNQGLDFFIPENEEYDELDLPAIFEDGYVAVSVSSIHATKRIPADKIVEIGRILHKPIMLLGGKDVAAVGEQIAAQLEGKAFNGCGKFSLYESASIIDQSDCVLTGDTGLMHIAAALNKPIAALWGNTVTEFGMYAYNPQHPELVRNFEIWPLPCRPCSKLGYDRCPRKHHNCMNLISALEVATWINQF